MSYVYSHILTYYHSYLTDEPILQRLRLDFNSDVPIEEQKEAGMKFLRQHCQDKSERAECVRHAREVFLNEQRDRIDDVSINIHLSINVHS